MPPTTATPRSSSVGWVRARSSRVTSRIGDSQTKAFIAGINGANVGSSSQVLVNSNGQLGTVSSSERFKTAIASLDDVPELMDLRPVSFRYKRGPDDLHYGLIAEEVGLDASLSPTPTSVVTGWSSFRRELEEAAGVALGRIIGFERLSGLTG